MSLWPQKHRPAHGNAMIALLLFTAAGLIGGYWWYGYRQRASTSISDRVITARVTEGPFDHIIIEQGEVESSHNEYIVCDVKSRGKQGTRILWVIEDGSYVQEGDLVVELDSSALEEELTMQRIAVANAQADMIRAGADAKTSEISIEQYMKGTYVSDRKTILSEIARAQQSLRVSNLGLESLRRLAQKGAINDLQIESAQYQVSNATAVLEEAENRLSVLDKLTKQKNRVVLESDLNAAESRLRSRSIVLREEIQQLEDIETQIANCSIRAPRDGVVIYNNITGRRATTEWVVEPGAYVRQRQVILKLPDLVRLQVKAHINETQLRHVREGMPAKVSVDAIPGEDMIGRVKTVKKWAKKDRYGTYVREFASYIEIIDPCPQIQIGMTAEVQVFAQHLPMAMQMPVSSVYQHEDRLLCLRETADKTFETAVVEIGETNDTMVVVTSGLHVGDVVAVTPHEHADLLALPAVHPLPDRDRYKEIRSASARHGESAHQTERRRDHLRNDSRPARGTERAGQENGKKRGRPSNGKLRQDRNAE